MTPLLWTVVVFAILLVITTISCVVYKYTNRFRFLTYLSVALCYFYIPMALLSWAFLEIGWAIGFGWACCGLTAFIFAPLLLGAKPIDLYLFLPMQGAKNFTDAKLDSFSGFKRLPGLFGGSIFVACNKEAKAAFVEMISQIKPQLKTQIKNPFKRYAMFHWRWYSPLVGGYYCSPEMGSALDDCIHNSYGFPISRTVRINASTSFAGVSIVEVNM